jgi:hypothetical protein
MRVLGPEPSYASAGAAAGGQWGWGTSRHGCDPSPAPWSHLAGHLHDLRTLPIPAAAYRMRGPATALRNGSKYRLHEGICTLATHFLPVCGKTYGNFGKPIMRFIRTLMSLWRVVAR